MIDLSVRVKSPVLWDSKCIELGLKEEVVVTPAVLDENGDVVTPAETEWRYKLGVNIHELGTVWKTKPEYDAEGNQTKSGVAAPGRHYNIRIVNPEVEASFSNLWTNTYDENGDFVSRRIKGATAGQANKSETAWKWKGIEFVDMTTVSTPQNVWL
jgi:hypothetical protein